MESPSLYSIELLGFASLGRDDATRLLAESFGIHPDEAVSFIERTPTVVRSGVDQTELAEYVNALLDIGADVRVFDEGSGAERTYRAADYIPVTESQPEPASSDPFHPSNFNARTVSGSYQNAGPATRSDRYPRSSSLPHAAVPGGGQELGGRPFVPIETSPREVVPSASAPAAGNPFERRPSGISDGPRGNNGSGSVQAAQPEISCPRCNVKQPAGQICAACGIVFEKFFAKNPAAGVASGSYPGAAIPPPSGSYPGAGSGSFDGVGAGSPGTYSGHSAPCDSCGRRRDYGGGTCRHCGWDNDRHFRRCMKCGSATRVTSANLSALYFLVGVGGAVGVVYAVVAFSIMAGLAVLASTTALTLAAVAITSMFRCGRCRETVDSKVLGNKEVATLRRTRVLLVLFAGGLLALALFVGPAAFSPPRMEHSSAFGRYSVRLPASHDKVQRETVEAPSTLGPLTATMYISEGPELSFFLMHFEYPPGVDLGALAEEEFQSQLENLAGASGGQILQTHPIQFGNHRGWELVLELPYAGKSPLSRCRVFFFGSEMVMFGGSLNAPSATQQDTPELTNFLESFQVERF